MVSGAHDSESRQSAGHFSPIVIGRTIGAIGAFPVSRSLQLRILFVCTGNICRSPTAERLAAVLAARLDIPEVSFSSVGTRAVTGHPIHAEAAPVLKRLGGDPSDFAAQQLTPKIAADADLILTMTRVHREVVLEAVPRQLHKTFTLSEAASLAADFSAQTVTDLAALRSHLVLDERADIADPIGRNPEFFARIGTQIANLLPPILELCRRSSAYVIE